MLIVEDTLTTDLLRRIIDGEALAAHVVGYCSPELCEGLAGRLLDVLDGIGGHRKIYHGSVRAFTDTVHEKSARDDYLADSVTAMTVLRKACEPFQSPVDQLRCELDELWPGGATLFRVDGRPLVFGMLRVWRNGAGALPHLDILGESAPDIREAVAFTEQLGVNIYLRTSSGSGEGAVELWDIGIADVDREVHEVVETYGFRRELLGDPLAVVHPQAGDLLLVRATRVHSVRPTFTGERVTLSGFVGHTNPTFPLRMWS